MLGAEAPPVDFSGAKIVRQIAEEEIEQFCDGDREKFKLSIRFGNEEASKKEGGSCVACGNCLSGCPYNAKGSTDKNYLASAIRGGCAVKTEKEALFVVKNPNGNSNGIWKRRWRVYFDDLEYISADFVVLSAGVLGTAKIMFQSQRRGLVLSPKIGHGFSCNGNNVAYVAGSPAPLNSYALNKKKFAEIPFKDRPGPSISSAFTSSLGFTIEAGVLPTGYPYLLFKGIATYGWSNGSWFLNALVDKLKEILGFKDTNAVVLNVMGYDSCDGRIVFDKATESIIFVPPHDSLLPRKVQALQRIARRLGGTLLTSRCRSTSVHLLGGCNASLDPSNGICNPKGQVFNPSSSIDSSSVHEGLYVCDASLIPCSVGLNPVLTITTAAEYVCRYLVSDVLRFRSEKDNANMKSVLLELDKQRKECFNKARDNEKVIIRETMKGFIGGMPCTAYFILKMNSSHLGGEDFNEGNALLRGEIGGHVVFVALDKEPLYIVDGEVDMCKVCHRTPYTQYMYYRLVLVSSTTNSRYLLEGRKVMNPYLFGLFAFRESRTLHVTLKSLGNALANETQTEKDLNQDMVDFKGELDLSVFELLKSLTSIKGKERTMFICQLLRSLYRTYISQTPHEDIKKPGYERSKVTYAPYPPRTLHELKACDGYSISCLQWKSDSYKISNEGKTKFPVLLLNGHSTESYCLPTEPNDLVRTLIAEGHEVWILQPRTHPQNCSNNVTIEDIGKFDIPAVIAKIQEMQDSLTKIHVVGHCIGGMAIHIALLGGYVHSSQIASISCTNSSMFFKLNASSRLKMRLPLISVSMAILGKNTTLSMFEMPNESLRHRLLKLIARSIPRHENCTLDECNIFSGIFGNSFWHENISESMHHWLNKEALPRLPMSTFPHLRKICNSGFIVDLEGRNEYLTHPERIAVPTLYVSGGRTILVTPQTSLLAHKYMKMHQPKLRHKRVVVDGFGHSDLLIGEEARNKVFPHIIEHIKLAEDRSSVAESIEGSPQSWERMQDEDWFFGACANLMFMMMFIVFVVLLFFV